VVEEVLNRMADRVYPSLHMSLRPRGGIFNFDGNGAFPDIVNRSLAFSLAGTLDLLRSVPPSWQEGSICGILARGQIRIDRLAWDRPAGDIDLTLTSGVAQAMTVRLPPTSRITSLKIIAGKATQKEIPGRPNCRELVLPANEASRARITFAD
jgi:hypothetical protein